MEPANNHTDGHSNSITDRNLVNLYILFLPFLAVIVAVINIRNETPNRVSKQ